MYFLTSKMEPWVLTTCYPGYSESVFVNSKHTFMTQSYLPHSGFVFLVADVVGGYCYIPVPKKVPST